MPQQVDWWNKPALYEWDGDLILLRVQMWCDLCWAACMDGADVQTDPGRRRERELEAEEWREAYRVVNEIVQPKARRRA